MSQRSIPLAIALAALLVPIGFVFARTPAASPRAGEGALDGQVRQLENQVRQFESRIRQLEGQIAGLQQLKKSDVNTALLPEEVQFEKQVREVMKTEIKKVHIHDALHDLADSRIRANRGDISELAAELAAATQDENLKAKIAQWMMKKKQKQDIIDGALKKNQAGS